MNDLVRAGNKRVSLLLVTSAEPVNVIRGLALA